MAKEARSSIICSLAVIIPYITVLLWWKITLRSLSLLYSIIKLFLVVVMPPTAIKNNDDNVNASITTVKETPKETSVPITKPQSRISGNETHQRANSLSVSAYLLRMMAHIKYNHEIRSMRRKERLNYQRRKLRYTTRGNGVVKYLPVIYEVKGDEFEGKLIERVHSHHNCNILGNVANLAAPASAAVTTEYNTVNNTSYIHRHSLTETNVA